MTSRSDDATWDDAMRQLERYVRERNEARAERDALRAELELLRGRPLVWDEEKKAWTNP